MGFGLSEFVIHLYENVFLAMWEWSSLEFSLNSIYLAWSLTSWIRVKTFVGEDFEQKQGVKLDGNVVRWKAPWILESGVLGLILALFSIT